MSRGTTDTESCMVTGHGRWIRVLRLGQKMIASEISASFRELSDYKVVHLLRLGTPEFNSVVPFEGGVWGRD